MGNRNLHSDLLYNRNLQCNSLCKLNEVIFWRRHCHFSSRNRTRRSLLRSCEGHVWVSQRLQKSNKMLGFSPQARYSLSAGLGTTRPGSLALVETAFTFPTNSGRLFPYSFGYAPVCSALPQVRKFSGIPVFGETAIYIVIYCITYIYNVIHYVN